MKLGMLNYLCIMGMVIISGVGLAHAAPVIEYREALFNNTTDIPVEIGYFYKSGRHSPSTFQSSGAVPAHSSAKKAVRLNVPMVARTPTTNTQFTVLAGDTLFTISGSKNGLRVVKGTAAAQR